jgi:hypothetical protein
VNQNDLFENKSSVIQTKIIGIENSNAIKSIKWFKNKNEINQETEMNLKLTNINHFLHNGIYYCIVELTNFQKIYSNSLNLNINCNYYNYYF